MKPLVLTMKAFGSYAEETVIDFTTLGNGIYLITGDTGAGKTTIFDGIVYALYGKASGDSREEYMMHTSFISFKVKSEVSLEFEVNGEKYYIKRTFSFAKGDPSAKISKTAELKENGKQVISLPTAVNKRIAEIIGLDVEQFKRIIMLAQGEFKKFLQAKSDERADILGKIFDSTPFLNIEKVFSNAKKSMSNDRDLLIKQGEANTANLILPEDISNEERASYSFSHTEVLKNIESYLVSNQEEIKAAEINKQKLNNDNIELNKQYDKCTNQNMRLKEKADAETVWKTCLNEKDKYEIMKEDVAVFAGAYRGVYPVELKYNQEVSDKTASEKKLESLKSEIAVTRQEITVNEESLAKAKESEKEIDSLKVLITNLEDSVPEYENYNIKLKEYNRVKADFEKAGAIKQDKEKEIRLNENIISAKQTELESLGNVDVDLTEMKNEYSRFKNQAVVIMELQKKTAEVFKLEREIQVKEQALGRQYEDLKILKQRADELNNQFILEQAAYLRNELHQEIIEKGTAVCPVCHTEISCIHEDTAENNSHMINGDELNEINNRYNDGVKNYERNKSDIESGKKLIAEKKNNIVSRAAETDSECTWEKIEAGWLSELEKNNKIKLNETEQKITNAETARKKADNLKYETENLKAENKNKADELNKITAVITQLTGSTAALETELKNLKAKLKYNSLAEAQSECETLKIRKSGYEKAISIAEDRLRTAKEKFNNQQGSFSNESENLEKIQKNCETYKQQFNKAVSDAGFESEAQYRLIISSCAETDGEQWIKSQNEKIEAYNSKLSKLESTYNNLDKETKEYVYTDLTEIEALIAEKKSEYDMADKLYVELNSKYTANKRVFDMITAIKSKLAVSEAAYERISRLSELVNGSSGEGGKLSFSRFAMGNIFKDIVTQANYRLLEMSGGKFELQHRVEVKNAATKAGLELSVLSNGGVPLDSKSLSGGESFMVSLSLALGLSDVVKNRAGGIHMDSMFIDEGFGSLDGEKLDNSIKVLNQLAGDSRQIGIISHIERLGECIGKKLIVTGSENGSSIRISI